MFNSICGFSQPLLIRERPADLLNDQPDALDFLARRPMPLAVAVVYYRFDLCFGTCCLDPVDEGFQVAATEQYEVRLQDPEQRVRVLPETLSQHACWIIVVSLCAPSDVCQSYIR